MQTYQATWPFGHSAGAPEGPCVCFCTSLIQYPPSKNLINIKSTVSKCKIMFGEFLSLIFLVFLKIFHSLLDTNLYLCRFAAKLMHTYSTCKGNWSFFLIPKWASRGHHSVKHTFIFGESGTTCDVATVDLPPASLLSPFALMFLLMRPALSDSSSWPECAECVCVCVRHAPRISGWISACSDAHSLTGWRASRNARPANPC